ncbi:MAG: RNA polymerase sigma factor [Solirubrobacteraceae bacterium]
MSDLALPTPASRELSAAASRHLSDALLATMVSRGHERAFASIYQRHHQALYRYCRAILHNHEDAQDALQNVMMRALVALKKGERDLALRPWLFRIAHNESVSMLRRRHGTTMPLELIGDGAMAPTAPGVEAVAEQRERLASLVADLRSLGERQRSALLMRELSGLSVAEIAAVLSTTHGAAKQLLFEARSALHELAAGRAMECESVRRSISAGDGRVLRGRKVAAHLRACADCGAFAAAIGTRRTDLRAIAPPLPLAAAGTMLGSLLAHSTGAGNSAGMVATAGAGSAGATTTLGGHTIAALTLKLFALGALATVTTVGALHLASAGHPGHGSPRHGAANTGAGGGRAPVINRSRIGVSGRVPGPTAGAARGATTVGSATKPVNTSPAGRHVTAPSGAVVLQGTTGSPSARSPSGAAHRGGRPAGRSRGASPGSRPGSTGAPRSHGSSGHHGAAHTNTGAPHPSNAHHGEAHSPPGQGGPAQAPEGGQGSAGAPHGH